MLKAGHLQHQHKPVSNNFTLANASAQVHSSLSAQANGRLVEISCCCHTHAASSDAKHADRSIPLPSIQLDDSITEGQCEYSLCQLSQRAQGCLMALQSFSMQQCADHMLHSIELLSFSKIASHLSQRVWNPDSGLIKLCSWPKMWSLRLGPFPPNLCTRV